MSIEVRVQGETEDFCVRVVCSPEERGRMEEGSAWGGVMKWLRRVVMPVALTVRTRSEMSVQPHERTSSLWQKMCTFRPTISRIVLRGRWPINMLGPLMTLVLRLTPNLHGGTSAQSENRNGFCDILIDLLSACRRDERLSSAATCFLAFRSLAVWCESRQRRVSDEVGC